MNFQVMEFVHWPRWDDHESLEIAWEEMKNIINIYKEEKNVNEGKLSSLEELKENKNQFTLHIKDSQKKIGEITSQKNILEKVVQSQRIHSFQFQNLLQD